MASRVDQIQFAASGSPGFAWRRLGFWFGLTLLAVALFGAAFALGYSKMHEGTVLPGVHVAGVDLAGLDRKAAEKRLRQVLPDLSSGTLSVSVGALDSSIPYAEIDRDYDFDFMLGQAFSLGRDGNFIDQLHEQVALLQNGASIAPVMSFSGEELTRRVAELGYAAQVPVVDAAITRENGHYVASVASAGTAIDVQGVVTEAMTAVDNLSAADTQVVVGGTTVVPQVSTETAHAAAAEAERVIASGLTVSGADLSATIDAQVIGGWIHLDEVGIGQWQLAIEQEPISEFVATYGQEVETPPTNATFTLRGNDVGVVPSELGRAVDIDPTAASIFDALQARADGRPDATAALSLVPIEPTLSTAEARAIAPRVRKLSEWTTHFIPGLANGNGINIQIPTSILNGQVVEPGAQFDFIKAIGPVTSPPYESGGALIHGQIKEDGAIGGGMCSVSTTLFNAALRFGLPIWARDNHSLYISRYPMGLDATVWSSGARNRQTMGFINDTGYPLVVKGINSAGAVTFQLWGVDDGRTVQLSEARIENIVPPEYSLVEYTNELTPGRRVKVNDAYDAFDTWVTRTVRNRAGEVIIEETYRSHYKKLPAYYRVGRSEGDPRNGRVVRAPR